MYEKIIPQRSEDLDLPELEHLAEKCIANVGKQLPSAYELEGPDISCQLVTAQLSEKWMPH